MKYHLYTTAFNLLCKKYRGEENKIQLAQGGAGMVSGSSRGLGPTDIHRNC